MDEIRCNKHTYSPRDGVNTASLHSPDLSRTRLSRRRHIDEATFMGHCLALGHGMFEIRDKIFLKNTRASWRGDESYQKRPALPARLLRCWMPGNLRVLLSGICARCVGSWIALAASLALASALYCPGVWIIVSCKRLLCDINEYDICI